MRRLLILMSGLALTLALAGPADAIVGGGPDGDGHPNVGALLGLDRTTGEYFFVCSGSLLADDEFLTAAHCTPWESLGQTAADVFVTFDQDLRAAQPFRWGFFGPVVEPDHVIGLDIADSKSVMPTYWLPPGEALSRGDVAVLHLARPASEVYAEIMPVSLPEAGYLADRTANGGLVGSSLVLVGYGFQSVSFTNPTTPTAFDGRRLAASAPFNGLTANYLSMLNNPRATGQGGICLGDSGGPNFLGTAGEPLGNVAVSMNVGKGRGGCGTGVTASQRLDLPDVLAFLDPWAG